MIDPDSIRQGMAVIARDGTHVGEVDGVEAGMGAPGDARIKLTRDASPDGHHHHVPLTDVARVDAQVHLSRSADEVRGGWAGVGAAGVATEKPNGAAAVAGHGARVGHVEGKTDAWLPWILGALALFGLLVFGLRSCDSAEPATVAPAPRGNAAADGPRGADRGETGAAAPVATSVAASQTGTATGGETAATDTNATAPGQAENRRTELVVLAK